MGESYPFSLRLVDEHFSDGTGIALIRQVRANDKDVPIIMQSAKAYAKDIREGLDAGANAYFTKPVFPEELIKGIKKLTDTWQE